MVNNNENYHLLFRSMPAALAYHRIVTDRDGKPTDFIFLHVNPAFEILTGLRACEIVQKRVTEVWPGIKSGFDWIAAFGSVADTGTVNFEQFFEPLQRLIRITAFGCQPGYFATIYQDLATGQSLGESADKEKQFSEVQKVEAALRESEERYISLINNLPVGIHRTTPGPKGRFILANPTSAALLGYESVEDFVQIDVCDVFVNPADRHLFSDALIKQGIINQELQLRKKDGTVSWYYESARAIYGEDGEIQYFNCILQDITDRKRAEAALHYKYQYEKVMAERNKEIQYRQLVEMSPTAIFVFEDGKITLSNQAAAQMLGAGTPDDLLNRTIEEFLHPGFQTNFAGIVEESLRLEKPYVESQLIRKDGQLLDVVISASYFQDHERQAIRTTVWDVSEYKLKEQELITAEKLESLSVLAGGIAHDFNNILTVLFGNLSLAKAYRNNPEKILSKLNEIEEAALQTKDLANQLSTFSKGGSPIKSRVSIAQILQKSVLLAKSGANVRCELDLGVDLYTVEVDEAQMQQVFNNLTINAVQAMPNGGTIRVKANNTVLDAKQSQEMGLREGKYVKISFADDGVGIPAENMIRIFDPFFTTKENGSGLGLVTVKSIIKKHDGNISVTSRPDVGTTFFFYLPAAKADKNLPTARSATKGKVLLMDDEEGIRKVASEILSVLGFEVDTAIEGGVALSLYSRARELGIPYDAVILDLTVPGGMGGKETISKLLQIDPFVKVIVSSGYSNDPVLANYREYGFLEKLAKPYTVQDMEIVMDRLLHG